MKVIKLIPLLLFFTIIINQSFSQTGWFKLYPNTTNYFTALYFIGVDTGYIGTSSGTIQKTVNGGINWTQQNSGSNQGVHSIHFLNSNTGYYTGTYGIVFKTVNGGNNWDSAYNLNTELFSIQFVNPNTGFTVSSQGMIYKTTNGGFSWLMQNSNFTEVLFSICFLDLNTGFVVGLNGKILKTTNGGINWISQTSNVTNLLRSVYFVDNNIGYISGSNIVLKTTNSGLNWNSNFIGNTLISVHFENSNTGYLAGYNGSILKTTNGSTNWISQASGTNSVLTNIFFSNSNTGYVVGGQFENSGIILKTTTGGEPIGIHLISSEIPKSFSLSQNFPNPFNPRTKIRFSLPNPSKGGAQAVKLIVYDALGREVETLVNEQLIEGTYEADWNAEKFSSGVYYYHIVIQSDKLKTEDYIGTKNMVLLK